MASTLAILPTPASGGICEAFSAFLHVNGWEWWTKQDAASWVGTCLFTKVCCKLAGQLCISLSLRPIAQLCPGRIHGKVLYSHLCSALSPALLAGPGWFQVVPSR